MTHKNMDAQAKKVDTTRRVLQEAMELRNPVSLVMTNEIVKGFIRGFADEKRNIVLISEKEDSAGMYVAEVKEINDVVKETYDRPPDPLR